MAFLNFLLGSLLVLSTLFMMFTITVVAFGYITPDFLWIGIPYVMSLILSLWVAD